MDFTALYSLSVRRACRLFRANFYFCSSGTCSNFYFRRLASQSQRFQNACLRHEGRRQQLAAFKNSSAWCQASPTTSFTPSSTYKEQLHHSSTEWCFKRLMLWSISKNCAQTRELFARETRAFRVLRFNVFCPHTARTTASAALHSARNSTTQQSPDSRPSLCAIADCMFTYIPIASFNEFSFSLSIARVEGA